MTAHGPLELINIYNPRDNGPRIKTWATIAEAIEAASGEVILLGVQEWGGDHSAVRTSSFRNVKARPAEEHIC
jgi:hypothetical protein